MDMTKVLSLIFLIVNVQSMKRSSMYIQKSNVEDLETSGTGYSYQIRSGDPFTFKSFKSDITDGRIEEGNGKLDDFPPLPPSLSRYYDHPVPLQKLVLSPNLLSGQNDGLYDSYGKPLVPYAKGFDNFIQPDNREFQKAGGSTNGAFYKSAHGEKGTSGYANNDGFAKGLKGSQGSEHHDGLYSISEAKQNGNHNAANHYANQHQSGNANRGGSFSNEKGHDKGSKTTGYHKVLHKDEFKKDHSFYDKADKKGFFNRYGDFDAKKSANEGSFKKGGHQDSGFKGDNYGTKGESDRGKFVGENKGYKGAKGFDKFFNNHQDFAEKGGKSYDSVNGYAKSDTLETA